MPFAPSRAAAMMPARCPSTSISRSAPVSAQRCSCSGVAASVQARTSGRCLATLPSTWSAYSAVSAGSAGGKAHAFVMRATRFLPQLGDEPRNDPLVDVGVLGRIRQLEADPGDAPVPVRELHAPVRPRQRVGHVRPAERFQVVTEASAAVRVGSVLGLRSHLLHRELTPLVCGVPLA